ncbi:uncharacterized protein TNCV_4883611 [Trichonephila clavipes]|nr:uncharacterized protein TNCV_4883611 [Trichonephila clavipes]
MHRIQFLAFSPHNSGPFCSHNYSEQNGLLLDGTKEWIAVEAGVSYQKLTLKETTRGLLATDHAILNHGQVTWTTPELVPSLLTTTPHQREDVSALDRFSVHRCPTRRVFSGTGLELVTRQATIRYLYHSATAPTHHSERRSLVK